MSRDVAQPGRAQRSGRWGRWFKSSRPDHEKQLLAYISRASFQQFMIFVVHNCVFSTQFFKAKLTTFNSPQRRKGRKEDNALVAANFILCTFAVNKIML